MVSSCGRATIYCHQNIWAKSYGEKRQFKFYEEVGEASG